MGFFVVYDILRYSYANNSKKGNKDLATLMEHEVLIELASDGIAVVSMRIPVETAMENPDYRFFITMHANLVAAKYEDLDFMTEVNKMRPLIDKYEKLPLYPHGPSKSIIK